MDERSQHWDKVFSQSEDHTLGWYQKDFSETIKILETVPHASKQKVFIAGAGTSAVVEEFLKKSGEVIVNDISKVALERLEQRVKDYNTITLLCQDISKSFTIDISDVDLWIDRAVLHFLTDDSDVQGYMQNLQSALKIGGYVLFAEFSTQGATQCAGLPIRQYDLEKLQAALGEGFKCVNHHDFTYVNPKGDDRPYIYALFQRVL